LKHCLTTSNIVERLFSRAKLILSERRKSMSPYHLELLLFLRANQELWNDYTIQDCYDNPESLIHEDELDQASDAELYPHRWEAPYLGPIYGWKPISIVWKKVEKSMAIYMGGKKLPIVWPSMAIYGKCSCMRVFHLISKVYKWYILIMHFLI
jgi:hypothetical protein